MQFSSRNPCDSKFAEVNISVYVVVATKQLKISTLHFSFSNDFSREISNFLRKLERTFSLQPVIQVMKSSSVSEFSRKFWFPLDVHDLLSRRNVRS